MPFLRVTRWCAPAGQSDRAISASALGQRQHPSHLLGLHQDDGGAGLTQATKVAILNANYIAKRLDEALPGPLPGQNGFVAHECIVDLRKVNGTRASRWTSGEAADGLRFHAPTTSFRHWHLDDRPTERRPRRRLDRFCEAMIGIREEIREIESGRAPGEQRPQGRAAHRRVLTADSWTDPTHGQRAAFPWPGWRERKFWPAVGRLNHVYGDRTGLLLPSLESTGELSLGDGRPELQAFLSSTSFFGGLIPEVVATVAGDAQGKAHRAGECLFAEGDDGKSMYIVHTGTLIMKRHCRDGSQARLLMMRPGDFFGSLSLIEDWSGGRSRARPRRTRSCTS